MTSFSRHSLLGGFTLIAVLLCVVTLLGRLGAAPGEALYLACCALALVGYLGFEWRLRRG